MKSVPCIAVVVSVSVCLWVVSAGRAAANPTDLKDALLNYKWCWFDHCSPDAHATQTPDGLVFPGHSGLATFSSNGEVHRTDNKGKQFLECRWSITGPYTVRVHWGLPGNEAILTFDPTFVAYTGAATHPGKMPHSNMHGSRADLLPAANASPGNPVAGMGGAVMAVAAPKPAAPAPPPAATAATTSRLDELIDRRSVLVEDIFSSLEREVPVSIRDLLADLRENLLDEAARNPAAIPQAYDLGARYCNGLIAAYDERLQMVARLRNNAPTNTALDSDHRRVNPRWVDYLRERDEAAKATYNNTIETPMARMVKVQWAQRAQQLRQTLDAFYGQFRAAARMPVTAKAH